MPGTSPGDAPAKRAQACSRLRTTKPAGFSASEATLATSLLGPMPTDALIPVALADLGHQPAHRGARRDQAAEVEVGLVEPDDLDVVDLGAHERHDPPRHGAVGVEVGRDDDRVGAQPPRARGGHGRADAEPPRLVGGGGDHRPRAAAGHDDRQAPQLRAALQLDRRVEGVDVEVGDAAPHPEGTPAAGTGVVSLSPRRRVMRDRTPRGRRTRGGPSWQREVELAVADVGPAVDDAHADRAALVAQRHLVPHGSVLWATPSVPPSRPPQPSALPYRPGPYHDACARR